MGGTADKGPEVRKTETENYAVFETGYNYQGDKIVVVAQREGEEKARIFLIPYDKVKVVYNADKTIKQPLLIMRKYRDSEGYDELNLHEAVFILPRKCKLKLLGLESRV